ncbi:hypothetical protein ACHAXT_013054 [Thalassiosira profunda]
MAPSAPRFRLLLHGRDGAVPYLTPELLRLFFCPEEGSSDGGEGEGGDDWEWRRRHFILGVAVKDTCVTPLYREKPPPKRKRKDKGGGDGSDRPEKRGKKEQTPDGASSMDVARSEAPPASTSSDPSVGATSTSNGDKTAKKPSGYTFLTHRQSSRICSEINSHLASDDGAGASNYMHAHLRIPRYLSTLIVPTFSLDYPEIPRDANNGSVDGEEEKKKHAPKREQKANAKKQKQQPQKGTVIPNSTKDTMPVDTPHGWQKIGPEQYCDAVLSLTLPSASKLELNATSSDAVAWCEGAVGLFDHFGMDRFRINSLFATHMKERVNESGDSALTLEAQKMVSSCDTNAGNGKWSTALQRLVHRTNDWSCRSQTHDEKLDAPSIDFWTPVHLAASHLPLDSIFAPPPQRNGKNANVPQRQPPKSSRVAIVGWDSVSYSREYRQNALRELMATLQSTPMPPKQYLVLSVSDLPSILDAARAGVSIIGTDVVRQWSRGGLALCIDVAAGGEKLGRDGMMDLRDERYARDSRPLLPGCNCISCRPRQKGNGNHKSDSEDPVAVPSFTRAYVHHLLQAKEMLAETLLFLHNLHQMLLLFRRLDEAAALDEAEGGTEGHLEAFCKRVEEQLQNECND